MSAGLCLNGQGKEILKNFLMKCNAADDRNKHQHCGNADNPARPNARAVRTAQNGICKESYRHGFHERPALHLRTVNGNPFSATSCIRIFTLFTDIDLRGVLLCVW